jgi:hypothetical protein
MYIQLIQRALIHTEVISILLPCRFTLTSITTAQRLKEGLHNKTILFSLSKHYHCKLRPAYSFLKKKKKVKLMEGKVIFPKDYINRLGMVAHACNQTAV